MQSRRTLTEPSGGVTLCTIVICTLALSQRAESLRRAIDSVLLHNVSKPSVLVVVNGSRFDARVVDELNARRDIQVLKIEEGSSAAALLAGRQAIATPYFGFLDDDDEYLVGAVDVRLAAIAAESDTAVVISNGWHHSNGRDSIGMPGFGQIGDDLLLALFRENWLVSCGALYRTDAVPVHYFEDLPRHIHWTWLAFCLAQDGKRIRSLSSLTFRVYETPGSSSKSDAYFHCQVEIYQRMLAKADRSDIARLIRRRLAQAWHDVSNYYRAGGVMSKAWICHIRSVSHPSGWKYLSYTRKLLRIR